MDSSSPSYTLNHAEYYIGKEDTNIIDLGLSLQVMQPEACYSSAHGNCEVLVDWNNLDPRIKGAANLNTNVKQYCDEESEGIQSKRRWTSVKVNMDGVIVGRKICILDSMDYLSLALQLEDMFGKLSMAGLRLFQDDSQFLLFYKDIDEQWRAVGDVPWKEFLERVKRLRIVRKNGEDYCIHSN